MKIIVLALVAILTVTTILSNVMIIIYLKGRFENV